jgi:hypothetical protein
MNKRLLKYRGRWMTLTNVALDKATAYKSAQIKQMILRSWLQRHYLEAQDGQTT